MLPLARAFVSDAAVRTGRKVNGFTPAAAHQLLRYQWPGNVRELENAVERAVVLTRRGRIDTEDLPAEVGLAIPEDLAATDVRPLADVEREYIKSALRAVGGNRSRAAQKLGIGEATLYRKIKQFGDG
jgi:DNA-binding NtrC family response regulator